MADGFGTMGGVDTSSYRPYQPQNMLEQVGGMVHVAREAQGLKSDQYDLATRQLGTLRSTLSSLLANPNVSSKEVIEAGGKLAAEGIVTPQMLATELAGMPQDPNGLRQWLTGHLANTMDTEQKLHQFYGSNGLIDNGTTLQPVIQRSPMMGGGVVNAGGGIQKGLTPGEQVAPQHVVGPNGQPGIVTTSEFARSRGLNVPGAAVPAPAPGKVTSAPLQPLPPTPTALPPGQGEAQQQVGAGSGQQLDTDMKAARSLPDRTFGLVHAIPALERLGTTGTGPTSEGLHDFVSAMQTLGVPIADPNRVKDYDEARKYLVDWVNRSGNTGTNDKLAAMFAGSPSVGISNAAAVDIAKSAVALERMKSAAPLAFQKTGLSADQYTRWAQQWAQQQDPRAYGFDLMAPDERAKFVKSLSPREKAQFVASLRTAHDNGLTNPGE